MTESPADRPTILVVDDTPDNLMLIEELLKQHYRIKLATSAAKALRIAAAAPPDLILLDVMMPAMDGHECCRRLKADPATARIPVIFLTSRAEVEDERTGFALGAVDYIVKPISPPIVEARVATHLALAQAQRLAEDQNARLEALVADRTREIALVQDATVLAMAVLAETRDNETGNHIRRTQNYVAALARRLQRHPRFAATLTDAAIEALHKVAPLHDIGKVGVPDRVLRKPGKLDPEEWEVMKLHPRHGAAAIREIEISLGGTNTFLSFAREIAECHHEKWDGSGYPAGLAGEAIPISARLMAVADVYDALISPRVYKPAFPHEIAVEMMAGKRGVDFDPDVLDAFLAIAGDFHDIAARFRDEDAATP